MEVDPYEACVTAWELLGYMKNRLDNPVVQEMLELADASDEYLDAVIKTLDKITRKKV